MNQTTPERLAAVIRYREQTLDDAALIAALATMHVEGDSKLRDLSTRQDDQLRDLLHDFAYKARKMFELAERAEIPLRAELTRKSIPGHVDPEPPDPSPLETYSLDFVLGRIIHSDVFRIERGLVPVVVGETVFSREAPWAFTVSSDRDQSGTTHFIFVEFLVQRFLEIDEHLEQSITR